MDSSHHRSFRDHGFYPSNGGVKYDGPQGLGMIHFTHINRNERIHVSGSSFTHEVNGKKVGEGNVATVREYFRKRK